MILMPVKYFSNFAGLEEFNADKSKCQQHFDVYKECKKKEVCKFHPNHLFLNPSHGPPPPEKKIMNYLKMIEIFFVILFSCKIFIFVNLFGRVY